VSSALEAKQWLAAIALLSMLCGCSGDESARPKDVAREPVSIGGTVTHELAGTRWALRKLGDRDVTVRDGAREPYFVLETAQHRIVGLAGCNRMTGGYELSGAQLRFSQMVTTRMACPDMTTESEFLAALDATVKWRGAGESLELLNAAGESVATLVARDL
jgi:heat shock protein HslJ